MPVAGITNLPRQNVFVGPGVVNDENLFPLVAGSRYMFPSNYNKNLPVKAYNDFSRKVLWKYAMLGENMSEAFDPDYMYKTSKRFPSTYIPAYIREGLDAGRRNLLSQISAPSPNTWGEGTLPMNTLKSYLHHNKYLVLNTDKNLGLAVVTADWYNQQVNQLLSDEVTYRRVPRSTVPSLMLEIAQKFEAVLNRYGFKDSKSNKKVVPVLSKAQTDFLRHIYSEQVETDNWEKYIPYFHGIPKVHKNKWALRPIVPCHSTIAGPAAKIVSKILKPIVNRYPIILTKSQDLARQIDELIVPPGKRVFLVTGDVKAFYTNVNRSHIPDTIKKAIWRFMPLAFAKIDLVIKLALLANDPLIFRYNEDFYIQTNGLAMGMHHSPDIANLYAAEIEIKYDQYEGVLIYRRYIDDIFSVIVADDEQDVKAILSRFEYPGLEIDWSISEHSQVYLDMYITWDSYSRKFEYRPYRKPLNHFERIPFNSYHPLYMKKAVILGELGRLARISSSRKIYTESVVELRNIYNARGYPPRLVQHIIDNNVERLWSGRRNDPIKDAQPVVVMKTELNPVWDFIHFDKVIEAIHTVWRVNNAPDSLLNLEFIISKSRSRNLGDVLNTSNHYVKRFNTSRERDSGSPDPFDFWDDEVNSLLLGNAVSGDAETAI